jgi:outer membrane protein assembly factor BamE (lipoprotein component of BamABCDE complex)
MTNLLYIPTLFGVSVEVFFILILLVIPTYYICRWLLKKYIQVEKTRKIASWTTTIIATPIIYFGIILLWLFSMSYHPTNDFDKQKWFANKETRYEISEDIIKNKMLIGKTKSEVRQLLGDEGNNNESNHWDYYLGFRPGIANIDPDVLDIEFKDGKVFKVGQHET